MSGVRRGAGVAIAIMALIAIVAWLLNTNGGAGEAGVPVRSGTDATSAAEAPHFAAEGTRPADPGTIPAGTSATAAPAANGATRLVVHASWAADGKPAADIVLRILPGGRGDPLRDNSIPGRTDASGTWTLDPAPPGRILVVTDRDGSVFGDVTQGATAELSLAIPDGTTVRGLVLDHEGHAAPDSDIWLSVLGDTNSGLVVARTGADGRFTLRGITGPRFIGAQHAGLVASPFDEVKKDGPAQVELTFELGGPAGGLRGLVVDAQGKPASGALVRVGPQGWRADDPRHSQQLPPARDLVTTVEGRFDVADLPPGSVRVAVKFEGSSPWSQYVEVGEGEATDLRITLEAGATLQGTARDAAGAPIEGVSVTAGGSPPELTYVSAKTDAAGRYVLRDPPLGAQPVTASKQDAGEDKTMIAFVAGETATWDPLISTGKLIVGRVIDESGAAVEGLLVRSMHAPRFDGWNKSATVAADGRFTIPNCEDVTHALDVIDRGGLLVLASLKDVRPGPDEVVIRIPATARQTASVVGRLVDGEGALRPDVSVLLVEVGGNLSAQGGFNGTAGEFSFGAVRAGDYDLHVIVRRFSVLTVPVKALLPGERRDLGTVTLAARSRIVVHATLPAGAKPENTFCELVGGPRDVKFTLDDPSTPTLTSGPLPPGDYTIELSGGSPYGDAVFLFPVRAPVHLEAGRDARVELSSERGVAASVHLETQRNPPPEGVVIVSDASGAELRRTNIFWDEALHGSGHESAMSFIGRPGPHKVRVESGGQVLVELAFDVPASVNIATAVPVIVP